MRPVADFFICCGPIWSQVDNNPSYSAIPVLQCAVTLHSCSQRFSCTNRRWATSPFLVTVAQFSAAQEATWELGMQHSLKGGGWAEGVPRRSQRMITAGYGRLQDRKTIKGLCALTGCVWCWSLILNCLNTITAVTLKRLEWASCGRSRPTEASVTGH